MTPADLTRAFLHAFETRDGSNLTYYAPGAEVQELPNRLVPDGKRYTVAELHAAAERGKRAVSAERYEVVRILSEGEEVAVEVIWTATLSVAVGTRVAGDTLRAHLGMFLTWRDGKIVSQRNYDCYEPF